MSATDDRWFVFDEYPDAIGWAERPIAGPFTTADEAREVLRDVAYPFRFPYGPATVVGDTFAGTAVTR